MATREFFKAHALPVFEHLSPGSKRAVEAYIEEGNASFRTKKLLEFFKAIDWLAPADEVDDRPLQKLTPTLRGQLGREINDYRMSKAQQRVSSNEKRHEYKLRVFEYYRHKLPAVDKALLESLRDYELDLTGRDVNWRHYFTLDSFKKIDRFAQAAAAERQTWIAQFKKDVATYKKNYDKLHHPEWFKQPDEPAFSFDDWCEHMGQENFRGSRHKRHASKPAMDTSITKAYRTLQLPMNTPVEQVKKQFRKLTLEHHPDLPTGSEEKMKTLVGAYHEIQRYWQTAAQVF